MATDEDPAPKKPPGHVIGQDLSALSIEELLERVETLKSEIVRIEAAVTRKRASRTSADQVFKR